MGEGGVTRRPPARLSALVTGLLGIGTSYLIPAHVTGGPVEIGIYRTHAGTEPQAIPRISQSPDARSRPRLSRETPRMEPHGRATSREIFALKHSGDLHTAPSL